jgi:hypothetical protein
MQVVSDPAPAQQTQRAAHAAAAPPSRPGWACWCRGGLRQRGTGGQLVSTTVLVIMMGVDSA